MAQLEAMLNQHMWNKHGMAGVVRAVADYTRDLLPAVAAVLNELHPQCAEHVGVLVERTSLRLEFGVPPSMLDIATSGAGLTRTQLLALHEAGMSTPAIVIDTPEEALIEVLGSQEVAADLKVACQESVTQESAASIELAP